MWPLRDVKHLVSFETTKTECHYTSTNGAHTDAKSQFLSKNSILMKSTPTLNLNFPAKNGIIGNLIFLNKNWDFATVCYSSSKLSRKTVWVLIMVMHPVSHYLTHHQSGWKCKENVSYIGGKEGILIYFCTLCCWWSKLRRWQWRNDRKSEVRIFLLLASSALKGYDYGRWCPYFSTIIACLSSKFHTCASPIV